MSPLCSRPELSRAAQPLLRPSVSTGGDPVNPRWREAIDSLESFLAYSKRSPNVRELAPLHELAAFVDDNADLLTAA